MPRFRAVQVFEYEFTVTDDDLEPGENYESAAQEIAGCLPVTEWDAANFYVEHVE